MVLTDLMLHCNQTRDWLCTPTLPRSDLKSLRIFKSSFLVHCALVDTMNARTRLFYVALGLQALVPYTSTACNLAAAPPVPVIKGLDYDHARAALLAAGWTPGHGSEAAGIAANQQVFIDRGYTELLSCSLDQANSCQFTFNGTGGVALKVTTEGEENSLLDTKAIVKSAELGCQL